MKNDAPETPGFVHEAAIYSSDRELTDAIVPLLRESVAGGGPTLVGVGPREEQLVRAALGDAADITFVSPDANADPLLTLKYKRELFSHHARAGPVRMVGQVPLKAIEANWDGWVRYEAAIGHVLAPLPVRAICLYDTRHASAAVLADVERTHCRLVTAGGETRASERFGDTAALLAHHMRGVPHPIEQGGPAVDLADPPIRAARDAVARAAERTGLEREDVDGLVLAASEVVTNAYAYGRPPVALRAWTSQDRVVVTVTDSGPGPAHPFVGLAPATGELSVSGFGLWIAHTMCSRVDHILEPYGFTVRLTTTATPR